MSKSIDCTRCNTIVDLNGQPVLCHVCPMGHVLCEKCNEDARYFCFHCGGKTERKIPDMEVKELYKVNTDFFMKKLLNSSALLVPEEDNVAIKTTVVGFKKWPRKFFHKIPDDKSTLPYNDRQFLEMLPKIVEEEPYTEKPAKTTCWDSVPKSFTKFEMPYEIMKCPITSCQYPICNFDATRHLLQSHENIPIEMLEKDSFGNFSVNTLCRNKNEIRALMRILVPGVITGLGLTKHKNCLPLYLLCTRVNILEAEKEFEQNSNTRDVIDSDAIEKSTFSLVETQSENDSSSFVPWKNSDCILIWCAGIVPLDFPLTIAISVYPRDNAFMNLGALVKVFPLNSPQNGHEIYKGTERLMITKNDLKRLTERNTIFDGRISIM